MNATACRSAGLTGPQQYRLDRLIDRVCERFGVARSEIADLGAKKIARSDERAHARGCIALLAHDTLGLTFDQVTQACGVRHRSNVARGVGSIRNWMLADPALATRVQSMRLFATSLMEVERL